MDFTLGTILGFVAISLAIIPGGLASSAAVSMVGRAGAGVLTEDPDKFGPVLLLQALPATQGVYGFLTGLMIMVRMGVLGGRINMLTTNQGVVFMLAALPIAIVGWLSAIYQGQVAAAGIGLIAKRPEEMGKAVILAAMVETYAVLALLGSLLVIISIQV